MPPKAKTIPSPSASAPWYKIPRVQAVSVEHPCLVKNVEKAIQTLGGGQAIRTFLQEDHVEKPINLKFHPEDPFNQPIVSVNCQSNNVLLKVTVPKRTGRKRKRGSNEPFVEDLNEPPRKKTARYLLESLQANEATYQIEPIASVPTVHVFRTMPDFAYSTSQSPFLNQFRDKILPFQYPLLSDFQLNPARGLESTEVIPPPALSTTAYPTNYTYRQNPAIKAFIDPTTGSRRLFNTQAPARIHTKRCHWNTPASEVPCHPSPTAPPLSSEPHNFRGLVTILRTIFARRPIWTRRGLANQLPANAPIFLAKYAIAHAAYAMRSGPWRDTYIRLGVDPRTDRSYRQYQSLMLQLVSTKKTSAENKKYEDASHSWRRDPDKSSHIFTGRGRIPCDGKSWQLCDLHDPLLKSLVDTPDLGLRPACEPRYFGWYLNGTWCKLKIILKAKIDALLDPHPTSDPDPDLLDARFTRLLALPESYSPPAPAPHDASPWQSAGRAGDPILGFLPRNASKMELEWAAQYRALCRAPEGCLPARPRLTRSKGGRAGFLAADDVDMGELVLEEEEEEEEDDEDENEEDEEDDDGYGDGDGVLDSGSVVAALDEVEHVDGEDD